MTSPDMDDEAMKAMTKNTDGAALLPVMAELLPCPNPWCESHQYGSNGAPTRDDIETLENRSRVSCHYCRVTAPEAATDDGAVDNWNDRADAKPTAWPLYAHQALASPQRKRGVHTNLPLADIIHQLRYGRSADVLADDNLMADAADFLIAAALSSPLPATQEDAERSGADALSDHFPSGLRLKPGHLPQTGEVFDGPIKCECRCGASFSGSDEQEVRQQWAAHAALASLSTPTAEREAGEADEHYTVAMERRPKEIGGVKVGPGLYRIHWKDGGSSLAAIGMCRNGAWWVAPTNWVEPAVALRIDEDPEGRWSWAGVKALECLDPPALTTPPTPDRIGKDAVREAVADLLAHRVGDVPGQGWLRDNDQSRAALAKLAALTDTKGDRPMGDM